MGITAGITRGLRVAALLLLASAARAGTVAWEIDVNTDLLSGTGYLDFQFNPGNPFYDPASASLTGFSTDGALAAPASPAGDVTGALPGTVVIANTDVLNEYTPGLTFGSFFDIFVTLDIPFVSGDATGGNTFTLDVEDSGFNSLLGSFPAVEIDLDATTGAPTVINDSNGAATVTQTPEPASLLLAASGLAGLIAASRRRFRSR